MIVFFNVERSGLDMVDRYDKALSVRNERAIASYFFSYKPNLKMTTIFVITKAFYNPNSKHLNHLNHFQALLNCQSNPVNQLQI